MTAPRPWGGMFTGLVLALAVSVAASAQTRPVPAGLPDAVTTAEAPGIPRLPTDVWRHVTFDRKTGTETTGASSRSFLRDVAGDFRHFFTSRDTYLLLTAGLAGSLAVHPLDDRVVASPFNSERIGSTFETVDEILDPGAVLGGFEVQLGASLATYGFGTWLDKPGVAALGRDLLRVQILTQAVTHAIKFSVQRTRPDQSAANSFPSGHTSSAFAAATVLKDHYGWKVGGPAYGIAAYIAASRLSENRHYLSDVVFGAAIGLAAGRTIGFSAGATRFELSPLVAPGGAGLQVAIGR